MSPGATKAVKEFEVHPYVQFMMDKYDPYKKWLQREGLPIVEGSYVADVMQVELADWERKGAKGAFLTFSDQQITDAYILEIAPGGQTKPMKQLYEEMIYITAGRGATSIWLEGSKRHTFEWEQGALFAIPLNASYQHFNASGSAPVRYFAQTSAPVAWELYRDEAFIYDNPAQFRDRFDPFDEDYFSRPGEYMTEYYGGILHANFIPDIRAINLVPREARGKGNRNMYIHMAGGSQLAHVSRFPVGTYKKAHRHPPGSLIYLLDSTGYTLMWNEGEEPQRYDWHEHSLVYPAAGMWHQHYNTGQEKARFVAFHASTAVQREDGGGEQIEFTDEDAKLRQLYVKECAKNGVDVAL